MDAVVSVSLGTNQGPHDGTTLFDQYRGLPRPHTFDLNAASEVDLAGVPDVTPGLGRAIIESAPYASVDDLARVAGMTPDVHDTFRRMTAEMQRLRDGQASGGDLSLPSILMPFVRRAVLAAEA